MHEKPAENISKDDELIQSARRLGATDAAVIETAVICIEDELARLCRESGCENYGLSASCPPHVGGPTAFRGLLDYFARALVFKIDVPTEILFSSESRDVFRLLHETAAGIERTAVRMGYLRARAYAGGSCKKLFCEEFSSCRVVHEGGECRNPRTARPSMSGFGINVAKLMEAAGLRMNRDTPQTAKDSAGITSVCGLVLLG